MNQPAVRDQRGFSMTELLVVCALLGIVMAAVLSLLMVGQQSASTTSNKIDAQANARVGIERMIEEIREAGYLPAGPTCPGAPATPCPPFNYAFFAISNQSATGLTIQNDWNANNTIQTTSVVDPISGGNRGEQTQPQCELAPGHALVVGALGSLFHHVAAVLPGQHPGNSLDDDLPDLLLM